VQKAVYTANKEDTYDLLKVSQVRFSPMFTTSSRKKLTEFH
jgi:hypothetical protein